jgi:integration host factor subunit alpha
MSTPLTKAVIVESVHNQLGLSKKECVEMVETLLEIIKSTLASGEELMISGFGKFRVKDKKERRGRNPATDEDLMLEPRRVVTFKCSGKLRDRVNDSGGEKL